MYSKGIIVNFISPFFLHLLMELSKKSVFIPIWQFELKSKGKWLFHDYDDEITEEKSQLEAEDQFEDFFESSFVDGIISFSHGKMLSKNKEEEDDAIEIIVKDSPKAEPIKYYFTNRGREEEALWITMFKIRTRTFPPKLYAD